MKAIERITVEGFKSIQEMDLTLRPLNVLIGTNGSGKSNFLSALHFLHELSHERLQLHVANGGGCDAFLYLGQTVTDSLYFYIVFQTDEAGFANGYSCILEPMAEDKLVFLDETASFHDFEHSPNPQEKFLGSGNLETQLNKETNKHEVVDYVKRAMGSWHIYHFHDTSETAAVKRLGNIDDNGQLRPDGANLAAYLYWLQQAEPDHYHHIVATVQMVAPFFDDFVLRPFSSNSNKICLTWRERGSDKVLEADALSDEVLRFICLATLLLQPMEQLPTTILLDEPTLGLSPQAIDVLAKLLHHVSVQTQVVVTTQSVTLINQFKLEDVIVVERVEGESRFRRLRADEGNVITAVLDVR